MSQKVIKKILLVEDDDADAKLTMKALKEHNLANDISRVCDGQEAYDFLTYAGEYKDREKYTPGLVLLDIKMPKMSGLDLLKEIRSSEALKYVPIVMLTSSREEQDLIESYKLGINAYVVKPVDFHQFIEAVKRIGGFWAVFNEPPPDTLHD